MKGTKEFYQIMEQFEKDLSKMPVYIGSSPIRYRGVMKGIFYENGKVNDLFIGYIAGYGYAKNLAIIGEFENNLAIEKK